MGQTSIASIFGSLLNGLESVVFGIVASVVAAFVPQLMDVSENDLVVLGNNFRTFLQEIGSGTPWGEALANMMTADWNDVADGVKTLGTDFAEAVATALEKAGLIQPSA